MNEEKFLIKKKNKEFYKGAAIGVGVILVVLFLAKGCSNEQNRKPAVLPKTTSTTENPDTKTQQEDDLPSLKKQEEIGIQNPMKNIDLKNSLKKTLPKAVDSTVETAVEGVKDTNEIFRTQLDKYNQSDKWNSAKNEAKDWGKIGGGFYKKTKSWLKKKSE